MGGGNQLLKVGHVAQARLDRKVVHRIVAVVRGCRENGREPEAIDAELAQVIQARRNAPQGAAEERPKILRVRKGLPGNGRKAIDKDLIDDSLTQPGRDIQAIDIELKNLRRRLAEQAMEVALVKGYSTASPLLARRLPQPGQKS